MRVVVRGLFAVVLVVLALGAGMLWYARSTGLSAQAQPSALEAALARRVRTWAIPAGFRDRSNPVAQSEEVVAAGLAHFADHCASCHANDGSGDTALGKGMFPPSPDMRLPATQAMTDGELFYVIEHGVRFTGMPAWGTGTPEGEESSWHLVHFIRHLPDLTPDELDQMERLNPKSPEELRQQIEEEQFLSGEAPAEAEPDAPSVPHRHPGGTND
jgi:mono/diheme cytochrome c family protein